MDFQGAAGMIHDRGLREVRDGGGGAVALGFRWCGVAEVARASRDAKQVRRLLALAVIYEGGTRSEAARVGGVTLQIVRDWVVRLNADGPAGLVDRKPPGCCPMLNADQRRALAAIVEAGPMPAAHGEVRWRLIDLAQWV